MSGKVSTLHIPSMVITSGACLLLICSFSSYAQTTASKWSATNLSVSLRQQISGSKAEAKAEPGSTIVEVTGELSFSGSSPATVLVLEIYLTSAAGGSEGKSLRRFALLGIGLKGNDAICYYDFPHTLIRGVKSIVTDPTGNGYELKKDKESDPAVIILTKNPSRICLAFSIPTPASKNLRLNFGGGEFTLPPFSVK